MRCVVGGNKIKFRFCILVKIELGKNSNTCFDATQDVFAECSLLNENSKYYKQAFI